MKGKNGSTNENPVLKELNLGFFHNKETSIAFENQPAQGDLFPLHTAQENVYFEQVLLPESALYNIGWHQLIEGELKRDCFMETWRLLYQHVDVLRLIVVNDDSGYPQQCIQNPSHSSLQIGFLDASQQENPHNFASEWMHKQLTIPVDYLNTHLSSVVLIQVAEKQHFLYIQFHHLAIDGIGLYRLFEFFHKLYNCLCDGKPISWLEKIPSFKIEVEKSRDYLKSRRYTSDELYWKRFFQENKVTRLTPFYKDSRSSIHTIELPSSLEMLLRDFCEQSKVSPLATLMTVVSIYFRATLGDNNIVLGTAVHGRQGKKAMRIVGMHSNVIPVACNIIDKSVMDESDFTTQVKNISKGILASLRHSRFPTSHIARLEKNNGQQLSDIQVLYDLFLNSESSDYNGIKTTHLHNQFENQPLQVRLQDYQVNSKLMLRVTYMRCYFNQEEIGLFSERIIKLLQSALQKPKTRVDKLPCLLVSEHQILLNQPPQKSLQCKKSQTIHRIFEETVKRTPDNIALISDCASLTYAKLNQRANQLAHFIRESYQKQHQREIKPDTLIALYFERGFDMVVSILAVLKAGGAYVPIDQATPKERVQFILDDTQSYILLTNSASKKDIYSWLEEIRIPTHCVLIDEIISLTQYPTDNLEPVSSGNDLAYVIYTSGTTGKPKGVLQLHKNVERLFQNTQPNFGFNEQDLWVLYHSYSFDFSVWELWGALFYGGRLLIPNIEDIRDFPKFVQICSDYNVTVLNQTPNAFYAFAEEATKEKMELPNLRYIIFGGDALALPKVKKWWDCYGDLQPQLINMYGITETTVHVTYKPLNLKDANHELASNIGAPVADMQVYILDDKMQLLPKGVLGEMYIGGAGLARGYLNRPELTTKRFVKNIFHPNRADERLYKTGDLARWLSNGNLEYWGRNDLQVKIRGYRIELGEIEAALCEQLDIEQAVVICEEDNDNKSLHAYIVTSNLLPIDKDTLRQSLSNSLPEYMLPASFTCIDSIPLTNNGKLDKAALPLPNIIENEVHVAPRSELEIDLCALWKDILGLKSLGINDDFFRVGGNSILAIRLVNQTNMTFHSQITVRDIFTLKTIEKCSSLIEKSQGKFAYRDCLITAKNTDHQNDPFPLTNVQQAYLYGRMGNFEMGNISTHLYTEYVFDSLDEEKIEQCINRLIQQHPSLRSVFSEDSQRVLSSVEYYRIRRFDDIEKESLTRIREELSHKTYDISKFPLFDFVISHSQARTYLHLSIDALLMDGSSLDVFLKELIQLYNSDDIQSEVLPDLSLTFRDYVLQHQEIRSSHLFEESKDYWLAKLDQYNFDAPLPMVKKPEDIAQPKFKRISKLIPASTWQKIENKAKYYRVSPTSIVLYAYGLVLSKWSGKSSLCINLTLFNRLPLHEKINELVGDFTVLELFNYRKGSSESIRENIKNIHSALWADIEHNLFDGIDFQRLIRKELNFRQDKILSPIVLTSVLGDKVERISNIKGYLGQGYSITQTSQVFLDNKAYETEEGFVAEWDYVEQLFCSDTIKEMHSNYCTVIEKLAQIEWTQNPPEISLSLKDTQQIERANSAKRPDVQLNLVDICYSSMRNNTAGTAVIDTNGEYSYQSLYCFTNRIAHFLYRGESKRNTLIGVLSEKSMPQLSACLGIMRSGAAYLPLHIDWPLGRINEVLCEGKVSQVMVSRAQYKNLIENSRIQKHYSWHIIESLIEDSTLSDSENSLPQPGLDDIAYVIFTSGSTGKPKGVTISHSGAVNTLLSINERFNVKATDKVLALSELSFDLSVYDLFGVLAAGGTIVFPDQDKTKDPEHWYSLIAKYDISIWNTVPQLMQLLVDFIETASYTKEGDSENNRTEVAPDSIDSLRIILMSGDWIPLSLPDRIKLLAPNATVMSLGGATEGSIWSIWYEIEQTDSSWKSIPYGQAMPNQKMYVVDNQLNHSPIGVIGEIVIGGVGIALNYWNDKEKTCASFIEHPTLGRIYKTGDLGRWNKAGYIEFEGRKDSQVKINGYRVELGEIENILLSFPGIRQAAVLIQQQKNKNDLVAYVVLEIQGRTEKASIEQNIREYLTEYLPEYMLPRAFLIIESFPLTANGKLNLSALPVVEINMDNHYNAPSSDMEKRLCILWQDVLNVKQIGIHDDFFRIGGDSILGIQLVSRLRQQGISIKVKDLFECSTISKLSRVLSKAEITSTKESSEQGNLHGEFELLPIQQWFFKQDMPKPDHWNQAFILSLPQGTSTKDIESALSKLTYHHDMLRSRFIDTKSGIRQEYQLYSSSNNSPLRTLNISEMGIQEFEAIASTWQNNFDIYGGHVWTAVHIIGDFESDIDAFNIDASAVYSDNSSDIYSNNNSGVNSSLNKSVNSHLFFAFHHLIIDTVSWRIIIEDLKILLSKGVAENKIEKKKEDPSFEARQISNFTLPKKTSSYRQWVSVVQKYAKTHSDERKYWQEILEHKQVLPNREREQEKQRVVELSSKTTNQLIYHANKGFNTEVNDLLLSAVSIALRKTFYHSSFLLTLEGHGREVIDDTVDVSRTVGWFTTMYPVLLTAYDHLEETIIYTKENLRKIPNRGLGFSALYQAGLLPNVELPLIGFNYLGILDREKTKDNDDNAWQITTENLGELAAKENADKLLLNLYGAVNNGCLNFKILSKLSAEQTEKFGNNFKSALNSVISRALKEGSTGGINTPSDYLVEQLSVERLKVLQRQYNLEAVFPATGLQQGFIYHHLSQPNDDAYRVQIQMDYHYPINVELYRQAWSLATLRYPALRIAFDWGESVIQLVTKEASIDDCNFIVHDLSHLSQISCEQELNRILQDDRHQAFDFTKPGLIRFTLVKRSDTHFSLLNTIHHIVADGWSGSLLWDTVHKYYDALTKNNTPKIEVDSAYFHSQEYFYSHRKESETYWNTVRDQWREPNDIYALCSRENADQREKLNLGSSETGYQQLVQGMCFDGDDYTAAKLMCREQGVTLNVALQFAWHKLLQIFTLDKSTLVGTIVSGRDIPVAQVESSVGLYINTLPLLVEWREDLAIRDQMLSIQKNIAELNSYSAMSLAKLQNSSNRMFHSLFAFENYPESDKASSNGSNGIGKISDHAVIVKRIEKHDYPIALVAFEKNSALHIEFKYQENHFSQSEIKDLLKNLSLILRYISQNPEKKHRLISLSEKTIEQSYQWLWNQETQRYPNVTLLSGIQNCAEKKYNNIAVITTTKKTTYRELNEYRLRIAGALLQSSATKGELIAVLCEKNELQIAACLAVMSAACAYLPLNIAWPEERLFSVLQAGGVNRILLSADQYQRLKDQPWLKKYQWIVLQELIDSPEKEKSNFQLPDISVKDIAYVIFTSGSTGKPKGVVISHEGAMNTIEAVNRRFDVNAEDRILALSDLSFDLSVYDLFGMLAVGGCIVFPEQSRIQDPAHWIEMVEAHRITLWDTVPQLAQLLIFECDQCAHLLQSLRVILMSGDWIPLSLPAQLKAQLKPEAIVMSLGGATEGSIWSIWFQIENVQPEWPSIPYGLAMPNQQMWVFDESGQPCQHGVTGEIHIGGLGVAKGYFHDSQRTEEQFFTHEILGALYKTGDLGAWNTKGYIEFRGRKDFQVKIRGYRVELGEIENALTSLPDVKQALVVDHDQDGNKTLSAYTVSHSGETIDEEYLRESISTKLPDYMLPSTFTSLKEIPLSSNGKLDRNALPAPSCSTNGQYVAARSELEKQLYNIWLNILNVKQIGIHDNFFRIGGDSILSIQMVSQIRRLGLNIQIKDLFGSPTIAKLATYLENIDREIHTKTEQGILNGSFDLLPVQQWFIDQNWDEPDYWNQAFKVTIPDNMDVTDIETALLSLAQQHDILRCLFKNGKQEYLADYSVTMAPLQIIDITEINSATLHEKLSKLQSNFNMEEGPLWCVVYLKACNPGESQLLLSFHHLIIDAVSWRIIADSLKILFSNQVPEEKTSSYRQWVTAIQGYAKKNQYEIPYWNATSQASNIASVKSPCPQEPIHKTRIECTEEFTYQFLHRANLGYHTEINDLFLSALSQALKLTFKQTTHYVTLEGHGRENIDDTLDLSRTVGWFTTMYPVELRASDNLEECIIQTKEMLRKIPNKGIGFSSLKQNGYLADAQLPTISFNYLGRFDTTEKGCNLWQISTNNCGQQISDKNKSHLLLDINGLVQDGKLSFTLNSRLGASLTNEFKLAFKEELAKVLEQAVSVANMGGIKTPSDYSVKNLSYQRLSRLKNTYLLETLYPATSLQQGFVFHQLAYPKDDAYRVQVLLDYRCALNLQQYQQAWKLASLRYPALRLAFDWEGDVVQIITADASINEENFTVSDITTLPPEERDVAVRTLQKEDRRIPFDLTHPGLIRFNIVKQAEQHYTILKTEHHSISDGWSGPILLQSVHQYYDILTKQKNEDRIPIKAETAYCKAQDHYNHQKSANEKFWFTARKNWGEANDINHMLSQSISLSEIKQVTHPESQIVQVCGDDYQLLKKMCRSLGVTVNVALQFAWHKLIQIYTGDEQSIVGTTISGRDIQVDDIESSVGLYINTLPLVVNWNTHQRCSEILKTIQLEIANLNTYSSMSLADLQNSSERLFHTLFVFENYPIPTNDNTSNGIESCVSFREFIEKDNYPLSIMAYEHVDNKDEGKTSINSLTIKMNFGKDWLNDIQAKRLLTQLQSILRQISNVPQQKHEDISLLEIKEQQALLVDWNNTKEIWQENKGTLHELFEYQVKKTPDACALVYEEEQLSYRELDEKANQLANALLANYKYGKTLPPDTLIALYLDRNLDMVISILAVLKAGGAYVPIAPDYPKERVQFILKDTCSPFILTYKYYRDTLESCLSESSIQADIFIVNSRDSNIVYSKTKPASNCNASDLAYVIYTSGTTGMPKGVCVEHKSVCNTLLAMREVYALNNTCRKVSCFSNYTFDVSASEIFNSLCFGGELHLFGQSIRNNPEKLIAYVAERNINFLFVPPAILAVLPKIKLPSLNAIIFAGDRCEQSECAYWAENYSLYNYYGPTEASIYASGKRAVMRNLNEIGKPIKNTRLYVLNSMMQPVAIGVPGELYIGGIGVARGYHNRPELTAERFINDPFATEQEISHDYNRLYKTGDLVKWLPDGNLEYIGRNDFQVKIRGYRIELGEIESALVALPNIKQAAVIAQEISNNSSASSKVLCAYVVLDNDLELDKRELISENYLRDQLAQSLPDYQIPSAFTLIDKLPLNSSGKLNRQALPEPEFSKQDKYVAPSTPIQEELCRIWQELLGIEHVGIRDNFFWIGGNSISAVSLVARSQSLLGDEFQLLQLVELKNIESISEKYFCNFEEDTLASEEIITI